jgi:predicted tellurium resistance membrane protein TerC
MEILLDPKLWCALIAIIVMESVLGVDNLVYLALLTDRQPEIHRSRAERVGLVLAALMRIVLIVVAVEILDWVQPVISILGQALSWRDILLVAGGMVLIVKGTQEIYGVVEGQADRLDVPPPVDGEMPAVINWVGMAQIALIDLAFAVDSVISAFALSLNGWVVLAGLGLGFGVLFQFAGPLSALFTRHPSIRVLIFCFMTILGITLVADGLGYAMPKEYLYFGLGLAAAVEVLELVLHRKR